MEQLKTKTTYSTFENGDLITKTVLSVQDNVNDLQSFFNEDGSLILSIPINIEDNLLNALMRLNYPFREGEELCEDVELMTESDSKLLKWSL